MSSSTGKQDMSMDDILASIRSYVSEGQNFPKSQAEPFLPVDKIPTQESYNPNVIQLTDEVIPIDTVTLKNASQPINADSPSEKIQKIANEENPTYPSPKPAPSPFQSESVTPNPFERLQSEIIASVPPPPTLSSDEFLNQLATPLIKNWLNQNLLRIVENIVEKERQRIKRG